MLTDEDPYDEGDVTVIGPECFAARDGSVVSWRGENYVPQPEVERLRKAGRRVIDRFDAGRTLADAIDDLRDAIADTGEER